MKKIIFCLTIYLLLQVFNSSLAFATADYYRCTNVEGGEWNYGRTPQVCSANVFGDDRVVEANFDPVVFDDILNRTTERSRYMNELHAMIRDASIYYIKKRKPAVSQEEITWWTLGIMTTASQESYWSHYRQTSDRRLKMMRGDVGHGHGMMQVDDRAHFNAIQQGIGWNLASNMAYAMDIFFAAWERAPSQSCVGSATNYTSRIRAAWAAYNGGPSRLCRWTNPNDAWARNDQNFYDQLRNKRWLNFIANPDKASLVNIVCLMENRENCSANSPEPVQEKMNHQVLYRAVDGRSCILVDEQAHCVKEERDRICLKALENVPINEAVAVTDETLNRYRPVLHDRHELCSSLESSLIRVGSQIELVTTINLRATPGGGLLDTIPSGKVFESLDFELRNSPTNDRYYKVQYNNKLGYIFAGNAQTHASWVIPHDSTKEVATTVAKMGQFIEIMAPSGINVRETPGGVLMTAVPRSARVQVYETVVRGTSNEIYYKISFNGRIGYIYSGVLLPKDTVLSWTKPL